MATTATTSVEATGHALRRLARRFQYLIGEITDLDEDLRDMVGLAAPGMLATKGHGVITTATLLITAGSSPERLTHRRLTRIGVSSCPLVG